MSTMEIAFDTKLFAAVRVKVTRTDGSTMTRAEAIDAGKTALRRALDCMDLTENTINGINASLVADTEAGLIHANLAVTEASLAEDGETDVFEVLDEQGNEVEED